MHKLLGKRPNKAVVAWIFDRGHSVVAVPPNAKRYLHQQNFTTWCKSKYQEVIVTTFYYTISHFQQTNEPNYKYLIVILVLILEVK